MLSLRNIKFPRSQYTCHLDCDFSQGERVVLMGKSGSGKTSLLSLVAGFETPTEGSLLWKGKNILALSPQDRPVTMLFQSHNLFPHLTVFENVGLGLKPSLRLTFKEKERVLDTLDLLDVIHLKNQRPAQLSGGEAQRVALARSLLRSKDILLLDEPFVALGPRMRQDLIDLVLEIQIEKKLTLFMATHHPEDALNLGGRLLFLDNGHITLDRLLPEALESEQIESYLAKN